MSNNSLIAAMFEEIKKRLSIIETKIGNEGSKQLHQEESPKLERQKFVSVRTFLNEIQRIIEASSQRDSNKTKSDILRTKTDLTNNINQLKSSIESLKCFPKKKKRNLAVSELKMWKIGSTIVLVLLLFCVVALKIQNVRLTDNDLKYRYINFLQEIDSTALRNMEYIFHIKRDKELINDIRQAVEAYELNVKEGLTPKEINNNSRSEYLPEK